MSVLNSKKQNKGFTLIELLVSIALFSVVVLITIGSILTIVDANRKARSLMTVMNNLNFAVESMTRSFQTGRNPNSASNCFTTEEVNYENTTDGALNIQYRDVIYCLKDNSITKEVGGVEFKVTSPDIVIDTAKSKINVVHPSNNTQPILFLNILGTVTESPKISSDFHIQTTVNQRDLQLTP